MAKRHPAEPVEEVTDQPEPQGEDPTPTKPAPKKPAILVRESTGRSDAKATDLLVEACERFGVNPDASLPDWTPKIKPGVATKELMAWRFYPGDPNAGEPDSVVIVTAGGIKLRHYADPDYPMDQPTEDTLARLLHAFTRTEAGEVVRIALPGDLTLPATAVTGVVGSTDHVYQKGYLKEGGKTEAARRADAAARR
jgi:hypothetical protein